MPDKRNICHLIYVIVLCFMLVTLLSCDPSDESPLESVPEETVPEETPPDEITQVSVILYADKTDVWIETLEDPTVVFRVMADGVDVTAQSEIFSKDGIALDGNLFVPVQIGMYSFYAVYAGNVSEEVEVIVCKPDKPSDDLIDPVPPVEPETPVQPSEGKSIVFVEGVTSASGWYDVNKMGDGTLNGDVNMCWAAASANMIQWWQDRYVAAGNTLPSTAVNGPGTIYVAAAGRKYELALMDMYHSQWNNDKGCHTAESIPWYFEGVNYGQTATPGSQAYPLTGGGYWSNIWTSVYPYLYHEYSYMFGWYKDLYTTEYTAYEHWGNGSQYSGTQRHKRFSELVVQFIERGIASMAVTLNRNGGLNHATTLWGYEIDNATGLLTRLWITDSDDLLSEPKQQLLNEYSVSYNEGDNFITLSSSSVRYGKCYVISLNPFSGYGSGI